MPTVSAARGCSPVARVRRPHLVRKSRIWTTMIRTIAISAIVLIIVVQILLFRTKWGLRTRATGEHPRAAETVGINVVRLRYRNVVMSGAIAALAGAYLSLESTTSFQANMSAGRGFIGLAAMIVGRWTPVGAFGAALLFASSTAIGRAISFAAPE